MFKCGIFIILSILLSLNCSAEIISSKNIKNAYLNFGSWQEYYMQVQETKEGGLNSFEFTPYFSLGIDYQLKAKHILLPELGYIIRQDVAGSSGTKDHFFLRIDYAYKFKKWLNLRLGSSFMWVTYAGDGSDKTLPNGSSTETYYAPEERRNTLNQTLDLGLELIHDKLSFRLQNYIYAANEENERLNSISLSINYLFPIKDLWKN